MLANGATHSSFGSLGESVMVAAHSMAVLIAAARIVTDTAPIMITDVATMH